MSLINRVAISNFMNVNGASEHFPWEPRFRLIVLNFFGQSTAINAGNGCGKTSVVKALLSLLSRNKKLISDTHLRMPPKSFGIPSHIQIELIHMGSKSFQQADLLVLNGDKVPGETWVFGMSGFRDDKLSYYFYPGTIEDCPTALFDGSKHTLLPPDTFDSYRKQIKGFQWQPHTRDWDDALSVHVSLSGMKKLATIQCKGSSDKGFNLFEGIKVPSGERFDEAFFFEEIAPEILAGAMDKFGEEGEDEIEKVIYNTVSRVINAKKNTEAQRKNLDQAKASLEMIEIAATYAEQSRTSNQQYQDKLSNIAGTAAFLETMVLKTPMPGIPSTKLPLGIAGEVAKHLIVEVGEYEIMILASGLTPILVDEPKHIRERAERKGITGRKIAKTVGNTCDLPFLKKKDDGPKPMSYTIKQARKIIDVSTKFAEGVDKLGAHSALDAAFAWFERDGDRNPFRSQLNELERNLVSTTTDFRTFDEEIEDYHKKERLLYQNQQQMSANEGAYDKLRKSGQFGHDELSQPMKTSDEVKLEHVSTRRRLDDFTKKQASLSAWRMDWNEFKEMFGEGESPHIIQQQKCKEKEKKELELEEAKQKLKKANCDLEGHRQRLQKLESERHSVQITVSRFDELIPDMSHYSSLFSDQDPDGLDAELLKEKQVCENRCNELDKHIQQLKTEIGYITEFHTQFGDDAKPADCLGSLTNEREDLALDRQKAVQSLKSNQRKRKELDEEQIAAGDAARQALELLKKHGIQHQPLYKVIQQGKMADGKQKELLSLFSALLFSPVVENTETGIFAAKSLAENNLPVPVLDHRELDRFCNNITISQADESSVKGLFIGVTTRAVECLLDPELVAREKEQLEQVIRMLEEELQKIDCRLLEIGPESLLLILVRRAVRAVEKNVAEELEQSVSEQVATHDRLDQLIPMTTPQALRWIKSAQEINRLGGIEEYEKQRVKKKALDDSIEGVEGSKQATLNHLLSMEELVTQLQQLVKETLPAEMYSTLINAQKFFDDDGVEFEKTEQAERIRLENEYSKASIRHRFQELFKDAQVYLDSKSNQAGETIQDQVEAIQKLISEAKADQKSLREEMKDIGEQKPKLKLIIEALDKSVFELIKKYRKLAPFTKDIAMDAQSIPSELREVIKLATSIEEMMSDLSQAEQAVISIADRIKSIDVEENLLELKTRQNEFNSIESTMLKHVSDVIRSDGLAVVEKEILGQVKGVGEAPLVIQMWQSFKKVCQHEEDTFQIIESRERENRNEVSERIGRFISKASINLTTFKKIARKNYGTMKANFIVEAEMILDSDAKLLVEEIIEMFDEEEDARRRSLASGRKISSELAYKNDLEGRVRALVYRRVFNNPRIHYEMEVIRAGGGKHLMDADSLSSGQKSAMSLMWAIRIADYAVEREARNMSSSTARNKTRSRAENILILDGLFSDLSDTDLIKSTMVGIEKTRGNFQLIGLIHSHHYDNDFTIFPNLLLGKEHHAIGGSNGWVSFGQNGVDGSVDFARIQYVEPVLEHDE